MWSLNADDAKTALFVGWDEDEQGLVTLEGKVYVQQHAAQKPSVSVHDSLSRDTQAGHTLEW